MKPIEFLIIWVGASFTIGAAWAAVSIIKSLIVRTKGWDK